MIEDMEQRITTAEARELLSLLRDICRHLTYAERHSIVQVIHNAALRCLSELEVQV